MKACIYLALLLPALALAELLQAPIADGSYTKLDGAIVKGSINVRANGCPTAPSWTYALDGITKNIEYSCPLDFGGDDYLLDTKTLIDGAHTITMTPEGGGTALTAKFTVANGTSGTPAPPSTPSVSGSSTVSWKPPTANDDGSALTTLAGFRVYYGKAADQLTQYLQVSDAKATSVVVPGLADGTWYFAVEAYTSTGAESVLSQVVSQTISGSNQNPPPPPPTCTTPQPAADVQSQTCPAGTMGTWIQTRTYSAAAYPTCWTAGAWIPMTAPTDACAPIPPTLKVAPISSNVRPIYEPVLAQDGKTLVLGTKQGSIASGKPCASESFRVGTSIYGNVAEVDSTLDSPTYKGRAHVAVCR